ncbi:MAG: type II secretion system protein [Acidimicrobiales bacterium]|nr:type II secretion system protein [Acidimicrobiales bacterium]
MTESTNNHYEDQLANEYAYRSVKFAAGWYFWIGTVAALIYQHQYKKLKKRVEINKARDHWIFVSRVYTYVAIATFAILASIVIPIYAIHTEKNNAQNNAQASLNYLANQIVSTSASFLPTNSNTPWRLGKLTIIPDSIASTGPFEVSALAEPTDLPNTIGFVYAAVSSGYGNCYLIFINGQSSNSITQAPSGFTCTAKEAASYLPTQ